MGAAVAVILAVGLAVGVMYLAPAGTFSTRSPTNTSTNGQSTSSTSGSSSQGTTTTGVLGQTGTMNIYLTDAPPNSSSFKYLLVNVSSVVLSYEGNVSASAPHDQWVYNVSSSVGTNVNLTNLVNNKVLLGATKVPAGNVTRIIFEITGAKAFFADGTSAQLKVVANGKLMMPINFAVSSGGTVDLTVDITPNSIHISQGHVQVLTPVIHLTAVEKNGSSTTVSTSTTETE